MLKSKLKPNIGVKSIILIAVCAAFVAVDLITKYFAKLVPWDLVIIKGWIELDGTIPNNQGCAFSFLNENPQIGQPLLISLTSVMLVFLIGVFVFLPERFTLMKVATAIVIAGAIGNLVDRLAFRSVRDFIGLNMQFNGNLVYCNFADFCITVGAILAVLDLLFFDEWAVFPLTKAAKAAQAKKKEEELLKQNTQQPAGEIPEPESGAADDNTDGNGGGL